MRDGRSRFAPPEMIARTEPYCLFLDELNSSAPEVQKAFYSLILGLAPPERHPKVRGRGGTVLQPGITLLERADDFPADAPILVITDGYCDVVRIRRDHAYLVPEGARLPFTPRGPVFRMTP